jgi:hypothetical protein
LVVIDKKAAAGVLGPGNTLRDRVTFKWYRLPNHLDQLEALYI